MTTAIAARIRDYLVEQLLPFATTRFPDGQHGGFHERLDARGVPLPLDYKRLLVQCRQLYFFSHLAHLLGDTRARGHADAGYAFLVERFHDREHGGWYSKTTTNGIPLDRTKDLYAHGFVLFALAHYYRVARDTGTLALMEQTMDVLATRLAHPAGGFHEAASGTWAPIAAVRRQNPHMHLLEGLLAAFDFTGAEMYAEHARAMLDLFETRFHDARHSVVGEFFDEEWRPHGERGHIIEPGHSFEWTWLLLWSARALDRPDLAAIALGLHGWAVEHGIDKEYGGIYDETDRDGGVVKGTKRIWPTAEWVQAAAALHGRQGMHGGPSPRRGLAEALAFLFTQYLLPGGSWIEHLDRKLTPTERELPGSTTYHILGALSDALAAFERTGGV